MLMLGQVLVFNHIHLFNFATPLLYIYAVLRYPRGLSRSLALLFSFVMGAFIDIFSNTPGVTMASLTLLGLIQPKLLLLFVQRDNTDEFTPSIEALGTARFIYYTLFMVLIYCLCFFSLESFNFFNWQQWLKNVGGSMALTSLFIIIIEGFRSRWPQHFIPTTPLKKHIQLLISFRFSSHLWRISI
mgnify:FL=1